MRRPIIVVFLSLFLMAFQAVAAERGALLKVRIDSDTSWSGRFMRDLLLNAGGGGLAASAGKNGVPELLRQKGIKVERVY